MSVEAGIKAENYFASLLNNLGIEYEYTDSWYDFLINKKYKVEVKSCQMSVSCQKGQYEIGRFDFTKEENREKQYDQDVWVCMIVRHRTQFILYGFLNAKELNKKRYISLHTARKLKPIDMNEWLRIVNKS